MRFALFRFGCHRLLCFRFFFDIAHEHFLRKHFDKMMDIDGLEKLDVGLKNEVLLQLLLTVACALCQAMQLP
jgi:hypothetical protein